MVYRGQVKDGVVVLEGPKPPPEGARVSVRVLKSRARNCAKAHGKPPTLYDRFKNVIGAVKDLPPDASVNLDHYLYGTPKRK
jgi:hypothetical protein